MMEKLQQHMPDYPLQPLSSDLREQEYLIRLSGACGLAIRDVDCQEEIALLEKLQIKLHCYNSAFSLLHDYGLYSRDGKEPAEWVSKRYDILDEVWLGCEDRMVWSQIQSLKGTLYYGPIP